VGIAFFTLTIFILKMATEIKKLLGGLQTRIEARQRVLNLILTSVITMILTIGLTSCNESSSQGSSSNDAGDPFEAGVAVVDITPPVGFTKYGYANYQSGQEGITSTGIKSPFYAKAIVFKQGDTKGAILVCDLIRMMRDLSSVVRERASEKTGIPIQNISISATHTHTGPTYRFKLRDYLNREAEGKLTDDDKSGYIAKLINGMVEALVAADNQLQEVELLSGIGTAEGVSFNRRYLMTDGRVRFGPGYLNPRIVRPAGPNDPNVHFLLLKPADSENFTASLTVFANHLDTYGGTDFHADYPYFLDQNLKNVFGEQFISVFGTGTCGNINHVDVTRPAEFSQRKMITEKIGKTLAEAIKETLPAAHQGKPGLKVLSRTVYLPLQDFTKEELEWANNEKLKPLYTERVFLEGSRRLKILSLDTIRQREAVQPSVSGEPWLFPAEIHTFRLDERTAIVTIPGEIFVELGLKIKEHSPFENTLIIELANSNMYYVPDYNAYTQGDYEPTQSRLAPGSGEKIVEEVLNMLNQINPD
jgi:hypothetical protein